MTKKIFNKLVSKSNKDVFIIAEISGNHQNSFLKLKKFVNECVNKKADIIKFQVYRPDTITLNSNKKDFLLKKKEDKIWGNQKSLYELYEKAHTPWEWIEKLAKILNKRKFPWFASVFDETSINFLEKLNCNAYKIASPEITDIPLIEKIAKLNKPIVISTGLATENDISLAVKTIKKRHNKFMILKCTTSYPSNENELDLGAIKTLEKKFKCKVGFSDHTLGFEAAKIASAIGANVFEKHFKLDNDNKSIDNHFSMKISDLKKYKINIEKVKKILGRDKILISNSAKKNLSGKRSLYVCKNIRKGERFTQKNIKSVRPAFGLHPKFLKKVLGKKSKTNLYVGERLKLSNVKNI